MIQTFTVQTDRSHISATFKDVTNWELRDGALILYKVGSTHGINLKHIIDWKAVRQP